MVNWDRVAEYVWECQIWMVTTLIWPEAVMCMGKSCSKVRECLGVFIMDAILQITEKSSQIEVLAIWTEYHCKRNPLIKS